MSKGISIITVFLNEKDTIFLQDFRGWGKKKYHVYSTTLNYTIFVNFMFLYSINMHIYIYACEILIILSIIYINIYILIF